jgi:hypothetical protein
MRFSICLLFYLGTVASCDAVLPTREEPAGNCITSDDCAAAQPICADNQCRSCLAHSECQSMVCDTYGDYSGAGSCVPETDILYVDGGNRDEIEADCFGTGTRTQPLCTIASALTKLAAIPSGQKRPLIRLLKSPNAYKLPPIDTTTGPVVLVGPGTFTPGTTATLITDGDDYMRFGDMANVVIDGVRVSTVAMTVPSGGKLTIRRSEIKYLYGGGIFTNATVTFDRDWFTEGNFGLSFQGSTVNITNSLFTGNTIDPTLGLISMSGGTGTFQFNTVAYNMGAKTSMAINCVKSANLTVKNSIFVQNGASQQVASTCRSLANSLVVGSADAMSDQIKQDPVFQDPQQLDLRPKARDAVNAQYLIDKALEVNAGDKNVDHDYFGTPRPQGAGYDIGACELVR